MDSFKSKKVKVLHVVTCQIRGHLIRSCDNQNVVNNNHSDAQVTSYNFINGNPFLSFF
jgi:hypothetical protein